MKKYYHFNELSKKVKVKVLREFLTDKELLEGETPLTSLLQCNVLFDKEGNVI